MCVAPSQQPGTLALHLETVSAQRIVKTSRPRNRVKIAESTNKSLRLMISTPKSFRPILFWSHSFEGSPITQLPHPFGHRQPEPTPSRGSRTRLVNSQTCSFPSERPPPPRTSTNCQLCARLGDVTHEKNKKMQNAAL